MEKTKFVFSRRKMLSVVKGLLASYAVTAGLLMLMALLLLKLKLPWTAVTAGVMFTYLFSCFLGGFLLGKGVGKNKFLWGLILGVAYFVLLLILSAIAAPGDFGGAGGLFATLLLCCAGGMTGGMLA